MTTKVKEILKQLEKLQEVEQEKVLLFIKKITMHHHPSTLLQLAGSIEKEDLKAMQAAIKKDCENIDNNEW